MKRTFMVWNISFEDGTFQEEGGKAVIETYDDSDDAIVDQLEKEIERVSFRKVKDFEFEEVDNSVFDNISFSWKLVGKSQVCSGNEYRVTVKYNNSTATLPYHTNYLDEQDDKEFMYCIISDACACEDASDILDFKDEFGYEDNKKCREAYKGCKKAYEDIHRLFSDDEYDVLYDEVMIDR